MARIASSIYEERFDNLKMSDTSKKLNEPALNVIKLNNNLTSQVNHNHRTKDEWLQVFDTAAFFKGYDLILKDLVIMVYEDPDSAKISTVLFSCAGDFCFNSLTLDHTSRFFVACQNLDPKLKESNTRRALAITLLKTYSGLNAANLNNLLENSLTFEWDETSAGELASKMTLVTTMTPGEIGRSLISMGFLQAHYIKSTILDVIYRDSPEVIDSNNKLVFQLGEQLEQLFDPLTEYSPESTDILYKPPSTRKPAYDDQLVRTICDELVQLQENTTTQLVNFLREAVIPIRMKALNGEIEELTTAHVNQVFPPTIDEITRINCIFLEALKAASPFGSFEIMKACGFTIPYFYKANMRHESAIKNFSEQLTSFLRSYGRYIPEDYTERQIESILKLPLNLTKVKMILDRLTKTKNWSQSEQSIVQQYFKRASDTIDSFGKDDLKPYNRRVLTPSGKFLTEICEGWPSIWSHGWMNRKVVSVIDTEDEITGEDGVIILFSDFILFATCQDDVIETEIEETFKPKISAVLMNSLINENPIRNIPQLKVRYYSDLNNLEITTFQDKFLKFMSKSGDQECLIYKTEDADKFINVYDKAKIMAKNTPFHLFRIEKFGLKIFATAHEEPVYRKESTRSPIVLFLNIKLTHDLLRQYDIFAGMSARFIEEDILRVDGLTIEGETFQQNINLTEFSSFVSEEVSNLETKRRSVQSPEYFKTASKANKSLLTKLYQKPDQFNIRPQPIIKGSTSAHSRRNSSLSSVRTSRTLPKIKETETTGKVPQKKISLKKRLSNLFTKRRSEDLLSKSTTVSKTSTVREVTPTSERSDSSSDPISKQSTPTSDIFDQDVPELSSFEDSKTFESSMSPIWSDDDQNGNYTRMPEMNSNWMVARENSSIRCDLSSLASKALLNESQVNTTRILPMMRLPKQQLPTPLTQQLPIPRNVPIPQPETGDNFRYQKPLPKELQRLYSDELEPSPIFNESRTGGLSKHQDFPTFNSLDDDFQSPLLKIRVPSQENVNEEDVYFTPRSFHTLQFDDHEVNEERIGDSSTFEEETTKREVLKQLDDFEFDSFDVNEEYNKETQPVESASIISAPQPFNLRLSAETITSEGSFKSCLEVPEKKEFLKPQDFELSTDDSFRYLSKIVDGSFDINDLNSADNETLPRSFSSIRYLAAYIDVDFTQEFKILKEE